MKKIIISTVFVLFTIVSTCFAFDYPDNDFFLLNSKKDFYYFFVSKSSLYAARIYNKQSPHYNDRLFVAMTRSYMPSFGTYDIALWEIDIDKKLSRQASRALYDEKTKKLITVFPSEPSFSDIPAGTFMEDLYCLGFDLYDDLVQKQLENSLQNLRRK